METNKSNNYLLAFLIASFFFTNRILGEILINRVGRGSILILIIANFLVPIVYVLLFPLYEKIRKLRLNHITVVERTTPFYLMVRIFITIYILLSLIVCIYFSTNFLTTYYFQNLPLVIYFILLILLVAYSMKNGLRSTLLFSNIFVFVIVFFYLFYITNPSEFKYDNLNNFRINLNEIIFIIALVLPLIFEPFLLIVFGDSASTPYKRRYILLFTIFGALLSNYIYLRQLWEFGALLPYLHSPFFESIKFLRIGNYSENGELFVIIYWLGLTYARVIFSCSLLNKTWNLRGMLISSVILFFACSVAWLFLQNASVFVDIMFSLIIISIFTLITYSILAFILVLKGGKKYVRVS